MGCMRGKTLSGFSIKNSEQGVALLLVLWIITLFSIICAEFSWTMRTETVTAANFKEGEQAYYTAEAGINKAIIELLRSANTTRRAIADTEEGELQQYWEPGSGAYSFEFAGGTGEVEIEDEGNKIGLNSYLQKKSNITKLKQLLQDKIGLEGEDRDIAADSLIDWRDKDKNITGINGAEDDYYESLDEPYTCRDGKIPVIEELLLVRGIDEEIFYGTAGKPELKTRLTSEELEQLLQGSTEAEIPEAEVAEEETDNETAGLVKTNLGLVNLFSVHSKSNNFKPNINSATVNQLLLLDGMDEATAREILIARQERKFESSTDRLPQFKNYEVWKNSITVKGAKRIGGTGQFTIKSRGFSPDGRISRYISCNVTITRSSCVITQWKEVDA